MSAKLWSSVVSHVFSVSLNLFVLEKKLLYRKKYMSLNLFICMFCLCTVIMPNALVNLKSIICLEYKVRK